jgi:hypothetical protein
LETALHAMKRLLWLTRPSRHWKSAHRLPVRKGRGKKPMFNNVSRLKHSKWPANDTRREFETVASLDLRSSRGVDRWPQLGPLQITCSQTSAQPCAFAVRASTHASSSGRIHLSIGQPPANHRRWSSFVAAGCQRPRCSQYSRTSSCRRSVQNDPAREAFKAPRPVELLSTAVG